MKNYKQLIAENLQKIVPNLSIENIVNLLEIPPQVKLGDFAFPCFSLAKEFKKSPMAIATDLQKQLLELLKENVEKIETNGPYLNFFLDRSVIIKETLENSIFQPTRGDQKGRIAIEFISANPNKPLHIGQARNAVIGDVLVRYYRYMGYEIVDAINYGDDSGVNVGYNLAGILYYDYPESKEGMKFDHWAGKLYSQIRADYKDDEQFQIKLTKILQEIDEGGNETTYYQKEYATKVLIEQLNSAKEMGVEIDLTNWETDILHSGLFEEAFAKLKQSEYITFFKEGDYKGCRALDLRSVQEELHLENPYYILIKSDGITTYTAKDIAYALWKLGFVQTEFQYLSLMKQKSGEDSYSTAVGVKDETKLKKVDFGNYNLAISVIDNRQTGPQNVVKAALQLLGFTSENKVYQHLPYGLVWVSPASLLNMGYELKEEDKTKKRLEFSSRKGWYITIDETLDFLKNKLKKETSERNSKLTEEKLVKISHKLAVAAFRFSLLKISKDKDVTFDLEESADFEGNTGVYVEYALVRLNSILNKIADGENIEIKKVLQGNFGDIDYSFLNQEIELELIRKINEWEGVLVEFRERLCPSLFTNYLIDLCRLFSNYYNNCSILKSEIEEQKVRVALLLKVKEVMLKVMGIVGLEEIERM